MNITKDVQGKKVILNLEGRLDTTTAPELENEIKELGADFLEIELDFEKLVYLSSAGLRVLLSLKKLCGNEKVMTIKNVNSTIQEVFDVTGFAGILSIL